MRFLKLFRTVRPFVNISSHRIVLLVLTSLPVVGKGGGSVQPGLWTCS